MSRRLTVLLVGAVMATMMVAVAGVAWAQEEPSSPTINQTPDETWMTNGVVYSVIRSGEYIYVGGKFTSVRSAPTGGQSFAATNLARFDADTGVGDPSWTPDVTGGDMTNTAVYALAEANGKIWVGGRFQAVDGIARRNLAAVSPQGVVDPAIDALVGTDTSMVRAMVASSEKVYIGGAFGTVDGKGRKNLAAINPTTGNPDLTWKPKADKIVWSLAFSCDDAQVFAGGKFHNAAGSDGVFSSRKFIARFDASSGALHPWAIPTDIFQSQDEVASDMAVTCERITSGFLGPNVLRSFRLDDGNTGSVVWQYKTGGEVQTATMLGPDKMIVGGHFSQLKDGVKRTRIGMINLSDGSVDPTWDPVIQGLNGGAAIGPWDLLVDENHLYVGGGFAEVGGSMQTHFARFTFTGVPPPPDTKAPTVSGVAPADGATQVAHDANAVAGFSEAMDASTINDTTFTLSEPDATLVAATVNYNTTTNEATLNPTDALQAGTTYTATIKGGTEGVKDLAGNPLAADKVWSFTTTTEVACTLTGTSNADTLTGTSGDDVICGGAGPDTIKGLEGNDVLKGEGGADQLYGGAGDDTLDGGIGTDTANFSDALAAISASLVDNTAAGEGSDTLVSMENLVGSNFNDTLTGSGANNTLNGASGADALSGQDGADKLTGGPANDTLNGGTGNDSVVGSGGADNLFGDEDDDTLNSKDNVSGNDSLDGGPHVNGDSCTTDATENSIVECEL